MDRIPAREASGAAKAPERPVPAGGGAPLPDAVREGYERRYGASLGGVRVHAGAAAAALADRLDAAAYSVGEHVVLGRGGHGPGTLAHELAHVVQARRGGPPTRWLSDPAGPAEVEAARAAEGHDVPLTARADAVVHRQQPAGKTEFETRIIPPSSVKEPGSKDFLAFIAERKMLILPATDYMVVIPPAPAGAEPVVPHRPIISVPTVGKESVMMVSVGSQTGFVVDAGGDIVVFAGAMAAMQASLGVTTVSGVAITHIHDDHVQRLYELVRANQIRPENMHYPAEFAINPSAPGRTFGEALQKIQNDVALQALGHGPAGRYGAVPAPTSGAYYQHKLTVGDVEFDFLGLTADLQTLGQRRAAGQPLKSAKVGGVQRASLADTASWLTRATHKPTGFRILFVTDLRGTDLTLFENAMGAGRFAEFISGIRVIEGFQHHMGALEETSDITGLASLVKTILLRSGGAPVSVLVQSQETRSGSQYLNRSLVEGLRQLGVDVHLALEAAAGERAGTFTVTTEGVTTYQGPGRSESILGDPVLRTALRRVELLREAELIMTPYEDQLKAPYRRAGDVKSAREALERAIGDYVTGTLENVRKGPSGRGQQTLADPSRQTARLGAVTAISEAEQMLTPAFMGDLRVLRVKGPYMQAWQRALEVARKTGRMPPEGIEALWELEPEVARKLVGESGMSRRQQRQTLAQLPGAGPPMRTRVGAGILIAIDLLNQMAPLISAMKQEWYDEDVGKALTDIMWWQQAGVVPEVEGLVNNTLSADERTTSVKRVNELLRDKDLDYLALTGIPDTYWDAFTIWASVNIRTFRDWERYVIAARRAGTLAARGDSVDRLTWDIRVGKIKGTTLAYEVATSYVTSPKLTLVLRAAAAAMSAETGRQVAERAKQAGGLTTGPSLIAPGPRSDIFERLPKATGRRRFKASVTDPTLYTLRARYSRTGYEKSAVFYTFPDSAAGEEVPAGYVVVGGADYNTYSDIYLTSNFVSDHFQTADGRWVESASNLRPNTREVLLAYAEDLEPIP